jgi:hypothetical protein
VSVDTWLDIVLAEVETRQGLDPAGICAEFNSAF